MKISDLKNGMTVLVKRNGIDVPSTLDMRMFGEDQPCLTFPEVGPWVNTEPYVLTDEEIDAFTWDAQHGLIQSNLRF